MGIDSFIPGRGEKRRAGAAAEPSGSPRGLTAFVCDGAELDGTLSSRGTIRIDGRFGGKIVDADTVVVGESGDVQADIHAKNVIVSGAVAGDVCASRQIVLKPSARVKGSIGSPALVVERGARVNGRVKMVRPEVVAQTRTVAPAANPAARSKAGTRAARNAAPKPLPAALGGSSAT
ncbi:MAG: polymer-forming cytoskeletal protein [Myxococcota bacterium]